MSQLRIFSYLPNPRLAKATIAARLCGVDLEIRGAKPPELSGWLWDFDARPLTKTESEDDSRVREAHTGFRGQLHKTDAFLDAHPFGTVPAAFSPDGRVGIFESNSIMRAVARLGRETRDLYGSDAYGASRIDSFLDASLIFARDAQLYLLALGSGTLDEGVRSRASDALHTYLGGIERALGTDRQVLSGPDLSLADIAFATEVALSSQELAIASRLELAPGELLLEASTVDRFPRAFSHFERLCQHEAFAPDLGRYLEKWQKRGEA